MNRIFHDIMFHDIIFHDIIQTVSSLVMSITLIIASSRAWVFPDTSSVKTCSGDIPHQHSHFSCHCSWKCWITFQWILTNWMWISYSVLMNCSSCLRQFRRVDKRCVVSCSLKVIWDSTWWLFQASIILFRPTLQILCSTTDTQYLVAGEHMLKQLFHFNNHSLDW